MWWRRVSSRSGLLWCSSCMHSSWMMVMVVMVMMWSCVMLWMMMRWWDMMCMTGWLLHLVICWIIWSVKSILSCLVVDGYFVTWSIHVTEWSFHVSMSICFLVSLLWIKMIPRIKAVFVTVMPVQSLFKQIQVIHLIHTSGIRKLIDWIYLFMVLSDSRCQDSQQGWDTDE